MNASNIASEMSDRALRDKCVEEAIEWMVAIKAGDMSRADFATFQNWQLSDENAAAWATMSRSLTPFSLIAGADPMDRAMSNRVLAQPRSRRAVLTGLGTLAVTVGGGALTNRYVPLLNLLADEFTLTAQNKSVDLPDGSRLVLAPRTAINVKYSVSERTIALETGTALATVAAGRERPFVMRGASLSAFNDAGRFMMTNNGDDQSVVCAEGETTIRSDSGDVAVASKGERVTLRADGLEKSRFDPDVATAWVDGLLVARNQEVAEVVASFRPYFAGIIVVQPAVSAVRVTGVFQLRDPRKTLEAMAGSLGLVASSPTPFWISIELGPRPA